MDRKCGEAVLRGSDIFAKGVRGMPTGTYRGGEVVEVLVDLDGAVRGCVVVGRGTAIAVTAPRRGPSRPRAART